MRMIRFVLGILLVSTASYLFAAWARRETEAQIGKMQLNAYNSPGAGSPVPQRVIGTGISTLGMIWWVQRNILRQRSGGAVSAMLLGAAIGVATLFVTSTDDPAV